MGEQPSNGRIISFEAAIALIVALINLALDQADIHIMLVSWISIIACIALAVDILRRTKWTAHAVHGRKRLVVGSGVIVLAFLAFGVSLSVHKKAIAGEKTMERVGNVPSGGAASRPQPEAKVNPPNADRLEPAKQASRKKVAVKPKIEVAAVPGTKSASAKPSPPESPLQTMPQVQINSAPNGIAIGGGTVTNPTVNNYGPPEPKVTWTQEQSIFRAIMTPFRGSGPPPQDGKPVALVKIYVDRNMEKPAFGATCERPCRTVDSHPDLPQWMGSDEPLSISGSPNFVGIRIRTTPPLGAGIGMIWRIQAEDGLPVRITGLATIPRDKLPNAGR